ncbi:hypothetical protein VTN49DRAFT_1583 [Thermomyces lanuginosus]|uniref:uncharacterized protein n=1 Tax=Thermomyces lanuginosus TaxID=5541 RepID=UPI003742C310
MAPDGRPPRHVGLRRDSCRGACPCPFLGGARFISTALLCVVSQVRAVRWVDVVVGIGPCVLFILGKPE